MAEVFVQAGARIRLDWGPVGGRAVAAGATYAVVVDTLVFTTSVTVAMEAGIEVFPYGGGDALDYAAALGAALALPRESVATSGDPLAVSLSPAHLAAARGLDRLVLPSPNGSAISATLADSGAVVLAGCLRNRSAVAAWLVRRMVADPTVTVAIVPAGERWRPDESLRPAAEDLWGAGSIAAALLDLTDAPELDQGRAGADPHHAEALSEPQLEPDGARVACSEEARLAAEAFRSVRPRLPEALAGCVSGQELTARGFPGDVRIAAELDRSSVVPVLVDGRFVDASGWAPNGSPGVRTSGRVDTEETATGLREADTSGPADAAGTAASLPGVGMESRPHTHERTAGLPGAST